MTPRGLLIVFEGIDGAGKSTQASLLGAFIEHTGRKIVRSAEPTRGPHGMKLRASMAEGRLTPEEELQLFLDDRRDHVERLIEPALARGEVVILDRYYFSTIAYQGARGYDPAHLKAINEAFAPAPDLLFILDLDPHRSLARIREVRGDKPDTFEVPELLARSRDIFLDLAEALPYAHVVDASEGPEITAHKIKEIARPIL